MSLSATDVEQLVEAELSRISDVALRARIAQLRVRPHAVVREWFYGTPGQTYECWTVLEHWPSNTGVAYCPEGFGPRHPWGLVFLEGPLIGIGADYEWFATLEDAVRDSMAWEGGISAAAT